MPLVLLLIVSTALGVAVALLVRPRLDPGTVTALAVTPALVTVAAGGLVVAVLAALVQTSGTLVQLDESVARWGAEHAGALSTSGLQRITDLGGWSGVVLIAVAVAMAETIRVPNRWIVPFLVVVTLGDSLITNTIKQLVDRPRPSLNPIAETLGPAFPSGHSSSAAALFAAVMLLAGRRRGVTTRSLLAGAAVGLAVAVAGTRVLLDVHWLSDAVAGLALGWAWVAICAIAFGERLLRFDVPAEPAAGDTSGRAEIYGR